MSLQIIKSISGQAEYVLLPVHVYHALRKQIDKAVKKQVQDAYVAFEPERYVHNPVALSRIKSGLTQAQLAKRMRVSQAYVSKLEAQDEVGAKVMVKVNKALGGR